MNRSRLLPLLGFAALLLLASGPSQAAGQTPAKPAPKKQLYTCPMHPQIIKDQPGRCPICGMNLVPVQPDAKKSAAPSGACGDGCCGGGN